MTDTNADWVLDGHEVRHASDRDEWLRMWRDRDARRVAETTVGEVWVSTVFLGIDHNFGGGTPLLFETMTFDQHTPSRDELDQRCWRYATWDEAEAGHRAVVEALVSGTSFPDD